MERLLDILAKEVVDNDKKTTPPRGALYERDGAVVYQNSVREADGIRFAIGKLDGKKYFLASAPSGKLDPRLGKPAVSESGVDLSALELNWESYRLLSEWFPFAAPVSLRERTTTIGCGDRLGRATPGHVRAVGAYKATPVLAQQSIRELTLTGRTFRDVVSDAAFLVFQEGFDSGYGADGDHLKTMEDIDKALDAGMPMVTLDLTEVMDPWPAEWSDARVEEEFGRLDEETARKSTELYAGKHIELDSGEVTISEIEAKRCALMYWKALDFTERVDAYLDEKRSGAYDLEVSIDETRAPTLPSHHLFIARELNRRGVKVNSLAPRFIGEFQKGIDYIGNLDELERQFAVHCDIARANGNYKVSVHSGSDKFSVYPIVGRYTRGRLHLKTAGTSWLEAVRAVAKNDPDLYRDMHRAAYDHFEDALALYHITADLSKIPSLDDTPDKKLPEFLELDESRQLLHITYGGLLNDPKIRERFFGFLDANEEVHYDTVEAHIDRHVSGLGVEKA